MCRFTGLLGVCGHYFYFLLKHLMAFPTHLTQDGFATVHSVHLSVREEDEHVRSIYPCVGGVWPNRPSVNTTDSTGVSVNLIHMVCNRKIVVCLSVSLTRVFCVSKLLAHCGGFLLIHTTHRVPASFIAHFHPSL